MTEAAALQLAESEQNPYLLGLFAPVRDEITAEDLEVIGEIPRDLCGVYLRNGPNRRYAARGRYHWFDGDGMVHAMAFEDGRARYRNRYVRTKAFTREEAAGGAVDRGGGEPAGNPVGTPRPPAQGLRQHRPRPPRRQGPRHLVPLRAADGARPALPRDARRRDVPRHPPRRRHGPPQGRRAHRRADVVRLRRPRAAAALRRGRGVREGRARGADRPARPAQVRWFTAEPCYIYHVVAAWAVRQRGPVRAARGQPREDDDGYLVSFVTDERDGRSEVEILDASDIAAGPVARVRLPQRVPLGFHATWVRADQLRRNGT